MNKRVFTKLHRLRLRESHLGKKFTADHISKIVDGRKGYSHSEETKRKISIANKGKKRSPEELLKMSERVRKEKHPNFGKHLSIKTKEKIGKGIKSFYLEYPEKRLELNKKLRKDWGTKDKKKLKRQIRKCFKYRQWRFDIFTKDDFTCQICGKRGGYLEADHFPKTFLNILRENNIQSFDDAIMCEELWSLNNGRTLCKNCHGEVH